MKLAARRTWILPFCLVLLSLIQAFKVGPSTADEIARPSKSKERQSTLITPQKFRSRNFIVHTDLPKAEAEQLLDRLEKTLRVVSVYWNRRPRGMIECYVAKDVMKWRESALPHRLARLLISRISGVTIGKIYRSDNTLDRTGIVLASAEHGVAEHEIVHAYCLNTFGEFGPHWYKEGMAEMAYHNREQHDGVRCPDEYVEFLRESESQSIRDILLGQGFTGEISNVLRSISQIDNDGKGLGEVQLAAWTDQDSATVRKAREAHRWNWALCYFLCSNSNYSERFRALGQSYLANRHDTFERAFALCRREIDFEFKFFIERFGVGYRVDLCQWDWSAKFRSVSARRVHMSKVDSACGYQPSAALVTAGQTYSYRTQGTWKTKPNEAATDANGNRDGHGRLVGVVMNERLQLSEPFDLGVTGTFTAPCDGKLYLRCHDAWNELADNQGDMTVRFKLENRSSAQNR